MLILYVVLHILGSFQTIDSTVIHSDHEVGFVAVPNNAVPVKTRNIVVTYRIRKHIKQMPDEAVKAEINRAFKMWSQHIPLVFIEKKHGVADIEISFEKGDHGDGVPFDGRGGMLAHTSYPENRVPKSEIHLDATEQWTYKTKTGVNLYQVVLHEIGHSLGLKHSRTRTSVMYPMHHKNHPIFALSEQDIRDIQALYGPKKIKGK